MAESHETSEAQCILCGTKYVWTDKRSKAPTDIEKRCHVEIASKICGGKLKRIK